MADEPTTTNDGLIYSIRDAVDRIEKMLADADTTDEYAQPANRLLTDVDEVVWEAHDDLEAESE